KAGRSMFQIDPDLMSGAPVSKDVPSPAVPDESSRPAPASLSLQAFGNLALDALYQLHRVGACTEEQATVGRTPGGGLKVQAIVASEKRKRDVLRALRPLADNPALDVQIDTEAEVARRRLAGSPGSTSARDFASARNFEITLDRIPAYEDLRR